VTSTAHINTYIRQIITISICGLWLWLRSLVILLTLTAWGTRYIAYSKLSIKDHECSGLTIRE